MGEVPGEPGDADVAFGVGVPGAPEEPEEPVEPGTLAAVGPKTAGSTARSTEESAVPSTRRLILEVGPEDPLPGGVAHDLLLREEGDDGVEGDRHQGRDLDGLELLA